MKKRVRTRIDMEGGYYWSEDREDSVSGVDFDFYSRERCVQVGTLRFIGNADFIAISVWPRLFGLLAPVVHWRRADKWREWNR